MRKPWVYFDILLAALAGWLNEHQQRTLDYILEENRVLRLQRRGRRLRLTDHQRRQLATRAWALGRKLLSRYATTCSPETILGRHRRMVRRKWMHRSSRIGRPQTPEVIANHVLRLACENPTWGYRRIQGSLRNLGHEICGNTVKKILKQLGIEPAPERPTTWCSFLRSHAAVIAAADFFTPRSGRRAG